MGFRSDTLDSLLEGEANVCSEPRAGCGTDQLDKVEYDVGTEPIDFAAERAARRPGEALRKLRLRFNLSLSQAAAAASVSPSRIEEWERSATGGPTPAELGARYAEYAEAKERCADINLVLDAVPLRLARQILGLPVAKIAGEYEYTKSTWLRFEANARRLPKAVMDNLNERLRDHMLGLCL